MTAEELVSVVDGSVTLTDGGLETTLIYQRGLDLPEFAAFPLLDREEGRDELRAYFEPFLALAAERGLGFILEAPTWRASSRWAGQLGIAAADLGRLNRAAIDLLQEIREECRGRPSPILISGCVGSSQDGYQPEEAVAEQESIEYHRPQIETFAEAGADLVTAMTMTSVEEAAGIVLAAKAAAIPVVISFTVETDGRLPSGERLADAIGRTDVLTSAGPAWYMVNCAHPTHFAAVAAEGGPWVERVRGVRANASRMSHEELDAVEELDAGDPADFGASNAELRSALPNVSVLGGCCGTDDRHIAELRDAWLAAAP
jgi:homocysteine S-methyltransferase